MLELRWQWSKDRQLRQLWGTRVPRGIVWQLRWKRVQPLRAVWQPILQFLLWRPRETQLLFLFRWTGVSVVLLLWRFRTEITLIVREGE